MGYGTLKSRAALAILTLAAAGAGCRAVVNYQNPEHNGFTTAMFNWDHVFLKGFAAPSPDRQLTGIVRDTLGTSDHDPVWAVAQLP